MQTLRHHIVSPLLSLLLIAGLAAPPLHTISHFGEEHHTPHDAPIFESEECAPCALAATLYGVTSEVITVSSAYAARQHRASAPDLVYALHSAPTDARAPPLTG
ncbi:MAG: hypothetical protein F4Y00_01545 [Bacteroidetes bacterium SB0662_bin_6]|nr:hypothetical protein [Bacteroidetes bacterium SB0668_bin_1]MYE03649.1 hypothetical protein [Bacteroidetes bacterium SB0662_bin_6]